MSLNGLCIQEDAHLNHLQVGIITTLQIEDIEFSHFHGELVGVFFEDGFRCGFEHNSAFHLDLARERGVEG